jgi:hypothetical protein
MTIQPLHACMHARYSCMPAIAQAMCSLPSPRWHLHACACGLQCGAQGGISTTSKSIKSGINFIIPQEDLKLGALHAVGVDYKEHLGMWCGLQVVVRQCLDREYEQTWHVTDDGKVWVKNLDLLEGAGRNVLQVSYSTPRAATGHKHMVSPGFVFGQTRPGLCVWPVLAKFCKVSVCNDIRPSNDRAGRSGEASRCPRGVDAPQRSTLLRYVRGSSPVGDGEVLQ